jgi:hypothetical protein
MEEAPPGGRTERQSASQALQDSGQIALCGFRLDPGLD